MRRPLLTLAMLAALFVLGAGCEDIVVPAGNDDTSEDGKTQDATPDGGPDACVVDADCAGVTPPDCNRMVCKDGACQATSDASRDGKTCGEADLCLVDGVCAAGVCVGTPKDCSALSTDSCIVGFCAPGTGECQPAVADDGATCEDGDPCTTGDTCGGGTCVGQPLDCSSLDGECFEGRCDEGQCVAEPKVGATCTSSDPCVTVATCDGAGGCVGDIDKEVAGCSEGLPCQSNADCGPPAAECRPLFCDGQTCVATQAAGTCFIDGQCQPEGAPDPAGGCGSCRPDVDPTAWSCDPCGDGDLDPGEACDDGNQVDGDGCTSTCELESTCLVAYGMNASGAGRASLMVVSPKGSLTIPYVAPLPFGVNAGAGRRSFARCGGVSFLAGGSGGVVTLSVKEATQLTATQAATFTEPHALACREGDGAPVLYVAERVGANVGRFSRHTVGEEGKLTQLDEVEVTFPSPVARLDFVDADKAGLLLLARASATAGPPITFAARFLPSGAQQGQPLALLDAIAARVDYDPHLGGLVAVGYQGGCLGFAPYGAGAALPSPKDFVATCPSATGTAGSDLVAAFDQGVGYFAGYANAPQLTVVEADGKGLTLHEPIKLGLATAPVLLAPALLGRALVAVSGSGSSAQTLDLGADPLVPKALDQATPSAASFHAVAPVPCGL